MPKRVQEGARKPDDQLLIAQSPSHPASTFAARLAALSATPATCRAKTTSTSTPSDRPYSPPRRGAFPPPPPSLNHHRPRRQRDRRATPPLTQHTTPKTSVVDADEGGEPGSTPPTKPCGTRKCNMRSSQPRKKRSSSASLSPWRGSNSPTWSTTAASQVSFGQRYRDS